MDHYHGWRLVWTVSEGERGTVLGTWSTPEAAQVAVDGDRAAWTGEGKVTREVLGPCDCALVPTDEAA